MPWNDPEYCEEASVARDRLRIASYYNARGYFDAAVTSVDVLRPRPDERDIRITVRESSPTHLADVRLRGCARDGGAVPDPVCDQLAERFSLRRGEVPTEAGIEADRTALVLGLRGQGYPSPRVVPNAMVDPTRHLAWVEYTVVPRPRGRFGALRLHVLPSNDVITQDHLPNGLPTRVIRAALNITPGEPFDLTALAAAQRNLLALGVFGVARIDEHTRPDGVVDLDVQLATARLWRFRAGGGFELEATRNNVHLTLGYEYRNFLGGMRRLRLEVRPQLSLPSFFLPEEEQTGGVVPGITASVDFRQPEMFLHTTGLINTSVEYGSDPFNPTVQRRESARVNLGIERSFSRRLTGSAWTRLAQVSYQPYSGISADAISDLTLAGERFLNQSWFYLEQNIVWDDRNNRAHATRGTYVSASLAESLRGPFGDYTFLRGNMDVRGYIPLTRSLTLAVRGAAGLAAGDNNNAAVWPVPQDLRFYSGGALSNRGDPTNRVGVLGVSKDANGNERVVAVGGIARWELSAELRWMPSAVGLVAFFDASQVAGLDTAPYLQPQGINAGCATTAVNAIRDNACPTFATVSPSPMSLGAAVEELTRDAHPSAGFGLRWLSPFGMVRADLGFRLAAGGCDASRTQIARQNAAVMSGTAEYNVITEPQCSTLPLSSVTTLSTFHLSLGETF